MGKEQRVAAEACATDLYSKDHVKFARPIPTSSLDFLMNVNATPSPGVPAIENFSSFGPVGVASPRCTIQSACATSSATIPRRSALLDQGRHASPDPNRPVFVT